MWCWCAGTGAGGARGARVCHRLQRCVDRQLDLTRRLQRSLRRHRHHVRRHGNLVVTHGGDLVSVVCCFARSRPASMRPLLLLPSGGHTVSENVHWLDNDKQDTVHSLEPKTVPERGNYLYLSLKTVPICFYFVQISLNRIVKTQRIPKHNFHSYLQCLSPYIIRLGQVKQFSFIFIIIIHT